MGAPRPRKSRQDLPVPPWIALILAVPLGALTIVGFEPVGLSPAPIITLAFLFQRWAFASTPREAFCSGYRSEEHTSELQSRATRRSSDLRWF